MNEESIAQYIRETFADVQAETADGSFFFFHGAERNFPMITLVTKDSYDQFSNLDRPGIFRLNIGISRNTFHALFGTEPSPAGRTDDFTALDQIMPHPVYAQMFWVCVLNPSIATFERVQSLLAEAYDLAAKRLAERQARG